MKFTQKSTIWRITPWTAWWLTCPATPRDPQQWVHRIKPNTVLWAPICRVSPQGYPRPQGHPRAQPKPYRIITWTFWTPALQTFTRISARSIDLKRYIFKTSEITKSSRASTSAWNKNCHFLSLEREEVLCTFKRCRILCFLSVLPTFAIFHGQENTDHWMSNSCKHCFLPRPSLISNEKVSSPSLKTRPAHPVPPKFRT